MLPVLKSLIESKNTEAIEERLEAILEESGDDFLEVSNKEPLEEGLVDRMNKVGNTINKIVSRQEGIKAPQKALDALEDNFADLMYLQGRLRKTVDAMQKNFVSLNKSIKTDDSLKDLKSVEKAINVFNNKVK